MSKFNQQQILGKLGITKLNAMQHEAMNTIPKSPNTVLLSPTGSGKTVAFLLPIIEQLKPDCNEIQAMILVPSRELAIQIEGEVQKFAGYSRHGVIYGGAPKGPQMMKLRQSPEIVVGTPGRILDFLECGITNFRRVCHYVKDIE